ncbi:peptidase M23 [Marivivens niveibacter]|uniref:Peptidase M23 n=1 Tax=Marivivens niveibacter TaxID=1930667 RepID=A0A251WZB4_9RHOB|nr:peptidoglycan DD-metalloendopeptidase family protein [Marivivens niveibacter]OUD09820.1 peptidase M23 [Marivivens niveibacter]
MIRAFAFISLIWASTALAQTSPGEAAVNAAQRIEDASIQLQNASSARDRVTALTETVKAYEEGLIALREGLRRAAVRQEALELELNAKSDEIAQLLGVLQSMGRAPSPVLLLHPTGPTGTARSGMILADVTPALQDEVVALRAQLEEVAFLRDLQNNAADTLTKGLNGAQSARAALSAAISDRTDLPQRFTEDDIQTALLIASAETLDAFASGLNDTIGTELDISSPDALSKRGELPLPVQGRVLRGFNEEDLAGISRPGLLIAARPRVIVTTPVAATLRFRGPLLDYGNVVILEPAADVLFIYAGLAEVFGNVGEILPAGSPIGMMGGDSPLVDEILTEMQNGAGLTATETLYLEVREGQAPVDPALWFAIE